MNKCFWLSVVSLVSQYQPLLQPAELYWAELQAIFIALKMIQSRSTREQFRPALILRKLLTCRRLPLRRLIDAQRLMQLA
jgi:hypothetical protein